ncbi:uncharacterized protein LOC143574301 [Bidens hawaiensis]|uniref:uncharacterized protein LOC143574301 n=1 Tax=Bidens hawaiensis TaxID=980011 RepID=UPI004049CACD
MEAQLHRTHERDHEDPQHSTDVHGEEKHSGEMKSTMKKVKEKVDKLKSTIKHRHHGGSALKDEAETVNNSSVVRSGLVEPTVMGTPVLAEDLYATHSDILDPPVRSFAQWQQEKRDSPPPLSTNYETRHTDRDENKEQQLKGSIGKHTHVQQEEEKDDAPPPPLSTAFETRHTDMPHGDHHTYGGDVNREQLKGSVGNPDGLKNEERRDATPSTGYESLTDRYGENREPLMGRSFGNPTGVEEMGRYGAPLPPPAGYDSQQVDPSYVNYDTYDQVLNRGEDLRGGIGIEGGYGAPPPPGTAVYETTDDQSRVGYDAYGDEGNLNSYPVPTGISAQVVVEDSTDTGTIKSHTHAHEPL